MHGDVYDDVVVAAGSTGRALANRPAFDLNMER